ncbi:anti-sigma factor family protein [Streptomonospora alba]|uniref:anti-sigma factor family protein n=1 Tax=Streptomonospora alba TaxID=183763 RepID=UPI0009FC412B|nr:zf-HC2 domain-containing protein [Streptomonospora alba]
MDHPGERLSALVDGELGHAERDRILRHLAACENCRFEAEMLRGLKRRLHGLDAPEPSTDFLGRLTSLSGPPSDDPPDQGPPGGVFGSRPPLGASRPIGGGLPWTTGGGTPAVAESAPAAPEPERARRPRAPRQRPLSVLRPRWERTRFAVAGVSVLAVALGTAFVAGGDAEDPPVVTPPIEDYVVEHAVTSRQVPVPDIESGLAKVSTVVETQAPTPAPR